MNDIEKTQTSEGVWMDCDDKVIIIYIEDSHRIVERHVLEEAIVAEMSCVEFLGSSDERGTFDDGG